MPERRDLLRLSGTSCQKFPPFPFSRAHTHTLSKFISPIYHFRRKSFSLSLICLSLHCITFIKKTKREILSLPAKRTQIITAVEVKKMIENKWFLKNFNWSICKNCWPSVKVNFVIARLEKGIFFNYGQILARSYAYKHAYV